MNRTLEYRRLAYLQEVEKKYIPENRKWWQSKNVTYNCTAEIAHQSRAAPNENDVYEFRLQKPYSLIIFALLTCFFFYCSDPSFHISNLLNPNLLFFLAVLLVMILVGFIDRRVKLRIDEQGIAYSNCKYFIAWSDIAASYVKTISNDGETHELIIHYYDESWDEFKTETISLEGYDKNYKDICFAIEYFRLKKMIAERN